MRRILLIAVLLVWCASLLVLRVIRTGTLMYAFLMWNLFLALIPLAASEFLLRARRTASQIWSFGLWLLFLPNAPYILTDLLHLRARPPVPLWFDLALLLSCCGTGLLLAFESVADVQAFITRRFGDLAGWSVAIASLALSAFGIYLGRFLRWNSWDVIANPGGLIADVAHRIVNPLAHPRTSAVTLIFGVLLTLGYAAFAARAAVDGAPRRN
jgi:uncharacterized membrane protein